MGNKQEMTAKKLQQAKADSAVVYKVMVALILMCAGLMGLRSLRAYYGTIGGMEVLDPLTIWIAIGGLVGFVLCALAMIFVKQKTARMILPWGMVIFGLVGITGLSMKLFWTQGFSMLYFLCCAVLIQYIVLQLYRWEFFLFSLSTVTACFLFLSFRAGFSWTLWNTLVLVAAVAVQISVAFLAWNASRHDGCLVLGKKKAKLFSGKYNPLLHLVAAALWLICIAAAVLLGGLFSYYCMFAAIAVEFIAAVYYTFQLN